MVSTPYCVYMYAESALRILEQLWQEQIYYCKIAPAKACPKSAHLGAGCDVGDINGFDESTPISDLSDK